MIHLDDGAISYTCPNLLCWLGRPPLSVVTGEAARKTKKMICSTLDWISVLIECWS